MSDHPRPWIAEPHDPDVRRWWLVRDDEGVEVCACLTEHEARRVAMADRLELLVEKAAQLADKRFAALEDPVGGGIDFVNYVFGVTDQAKALLAELKGEAKP